MIRMRVFLSTVPLCMCNHITLVFNQNMLRQLFWIGLLGLVLSSEYSHIKDYDEYLEKWEKIVPKEYIHDVSHLAVNNELCSGTKCKFVYYEYLSPGRIEKDRNRTVLLVSGMHGNEYLGPHALLYGYQHFEAAHIIYFPVANPSGFSVNQRLTQPSQLDPNRDFPVDGNQECYQTNAALILDYLFRTFEFDLTLILHDGSTEIGFNWGTFTHQKNSHTEDYDIQLSIAEMMRQAAGNNKELMQFKVGTMDEVIYPAKGSFDDWAYAIGKHPTVVTNKCLGLELQPYSEAMASDLVFLLELGPHQSSVFGSEQAVSNNESEKYGPDGYVSRAIRMVREGLKAVSPVLHVEWKETAVDITVEGCSSALITMLDLFEMELVSDMRGANYLLSLDDPIEVQGNCGPLPPKPTTIPYERTPYDLFNRNKNYLGAFECGKEWVGKGSTSFAKVRKYRFDVWEQKKQREEQPPPPPTPEDTRNFIERWIQSETLDDFVWIGVVLICILALMSAIFAVLQCLLRPKEEHRQKIDHGTMEEMEGGEDLHTARGGIIEENM